jgi:uncharacterized protein YyaL (SSP411 family)
MKKRSQLSLAFQFLLFAAALLPGAGINAQEAKETRKPLPSPEEIAKLPKDGGPDYNRLIFEKSPYLLQHAANPVDWHPWGEEAFALAREHNKPIFLSVGYSTCHWCHVMEKESFEDEEVAALLNEHFIPVKVDREERPDIDQIYMTATQAITGSGGWPNNLVLTPEGEPFFAATYVPKHERSGRPGMMELLPAISAAWKDKRDQLAEMAGEISAHLRQLSQSSGQEEAELGLENLRAAYGELSAQYDDVHGGFGIAPKFPRAPNLTFLLRYWKRTGDARALEMVEETLQAMRRGGIYDHVGYGFHRYATDSTWLLPHFEKMLYDQALLAIAYAEAYQATRNEEYANTVREILTYVERDMRSPVQAEGAIYSSRTMKTPQGAFFSAEDADSEGEEGKFYVWSAEEVAGILGKDGAELFMKVYGFEEGGNFLEQATGHKTGTNIPHLKKPFPEITKELSIDEASLRERIEASREKLFAARKERVHPLKDDKVLADWNGLMIAAFAIAGRVLDEPKYTKMAAQAADFMFIHMDDGKGGLLHRWRGGEAEIMGMLDDYAFYVWGLLEVYESNFGAKYLKWAMEMNEYALEHFWDDERGGFFQTADGAEKLLMRPKDAYDGATPSGNSVMALNLLRLARMTGKMEWETKADETMKAFARDIHRAPLAFTQMLCALDFSVGPSYEIVIAGDDAAEDSQAMIRAIRSQFIPNKVVVFTWKNMPAANPIFEYAPYTAAMTAREGKATAYVCENFACNSPTTSIDEMMELLHGTKGAADATARSR